MKFKHLYPGKSVKTIQVPEKMKQPQFLEKFFILMILLHMLRDGTTFTEQTVWSSRSSFKCCKFPVIAHSRF